MNESAYKLLNIIYPSGKYSIEDLIASWKYSLHLTEIVFWEAVDYLRDDRNELAIFEVLDIRTLEITQKGKIIFEQERVKGNTQLSPKEADLLNSFLESGNIHIGKPFSRFGEIELRNTVFFDTKIFWEKGLIEDTGEKFTLDPKSKTCITWTSNGRKLLKLENWYAFLELEKKERATHMQNKSTGNEAINPKLENHFHFDKVENSQFNTGNIFSSTQANNIETLSDSPKGKENTFLGMSMKTIKEGVTYSLIVFFIVSLFTWALPKMGCNKSNDAISDTAKHKTNTYFK